VIVGIAAGLSPEQLTPWAASARKVWPGRIVILTDDADPLDPLAAEYDLELRMVPLREKGMGVCDIARTRWLHIGELLGSTNKDPACVVDTRDAVFQTNPLAMVRRRILLGSEGKTHLENPWTAYWVNQLAPNDGIEDAEVLNAGAIAGPEFLLRCFAFALFHRLPKIKCSCTFGATHMTDQTLVNVLARNGFASNVDIRKDWVFHVRAMDHGRIGATWHDDLHVLLRDDGHPFPIVHQYDLAPQLKPFLEAIR